MSWAEKELKKAKLKKKIDEVMKSPEYKQREKEQNLGVFLTYCIISVDYLFRHENYGPRRVKRFLDFVKQQMKYVADDDEYNFRELNDELEKDTGVNVMAYMGFWENDEGRAEMERLTIKAPSGLIHLKCDDEKFRNKAIKILSDYEDTGLTPTEITELKERDTAKKPMQTEEGMVCPMCGNKAYPWNKFCDACGQRWWEE